MKCTLLFFVFIVYQDTLIKNYCIESTNNNQSIPYIDKNVNTKIRIWINPESDQEDFSEIIFVKNHKGWQGFYLKGEYVLRIHLQDYSWPEWFQHLQLLGIFELEGGGNLPYSGCEIDGKRYIPIGDHYGACVQYEHEGKAGSYYYLLPAQCDFAKHCPEFEHACKMRKIFTFLNKSTRVKVNGKELKMNQVGYEN